MKQHSTYKDEVLYQQIMAELKPGADEYDRLMFEGEAPVSKVEHNVGKSKVVPMRKAHSYIYKYVAAASILFAIIGTSLYMIIGYEDNIQPSIAQRGRAIRIDSIATPCTTSPLGGMGTDNVIAKSSGSIANPVKTAKEIIKNDSADAENDEQEQEFLYALITEVESRALTEQEEEDMLYRSIIEEITANMSNKSNIPELIL